MRNRLLGYTIPVILIAATLSGLLVSRTNGQSMDEMHGCTTILLGKGFTADGSVIMGHNEDMGKMSGRLKYHPRQKHTQKWISLNYVTLPQVPETYGYWASGNSQPVADQFFDGGWILTGMNEFGVSLACNTMSTREEKIPKGRGIIRYSIRKLILERMESARRGVELIGELIDEYGQCGSPVAYCIADPEEAWLVETTYRHWIARRIPDEGLAVIANQYTIETEWDMMSDRLIDDAIDRGWYDVKDGPFNFKAAYMKPSDLDRPRNTSREYQGRVALRDKKGSITVEDVLSILSLPPIQTTSTQSATIWHLRDDISHDIGCTMWFGMNGGNSNVLIPIFAGSSKVPVSYMDASVEYDSTSAWWQFERLQNLIYPRSGEYAESYKDAAKRLSETQDRIFHETEMIRTKAMELLNRGNITAANEILSNHTYENLSRALSEARTLISRIGSN